MRAERRSSELTPESPGPPVKVLYLMGYPRSGSTIVTSAFGSCEGFVGVGEARYLWYPRLEPTRVCGCRQLVSACEFWNEVHRLEAVPAPVRAVVERDGLARQQRALSKLTRFVPMLYGARPAAPGSDLFTYAEARTRAYRCMAEAGGGRVVVDSSKFPYDAAIVQRMAGIDLHVVHLLRDPRGSLFSRLSGQGEKLQRLRPLIAVKEVATWLVSFGAARLIVRRLGRHRARTLRYEDFVADPEREMRGILEWMGEGHIEPPPSEGTTLRLRPVHQVSGNRVRTRFGEVELRHDLRWRTELGRPYRWLISVATAPVRRRHGYR